MRILIVPLPALAQTNGSQVRVTQLIKGFKSSGFEVATCAALDHNFKKQLDIPNYFLEVPIPLGLPKNIGKNFFHLATILGIAGKKEVKSFEEILFLTGALNERYFAKNIECVREAIQKFKPDVVYSEFNLGTIVAGKLEKVKVVTNYSYPVQPSFACTPHLAKGVNKVLSGLKLPQVNSALELFDLADYKIVPSSYQLEPIEGEHVIFTGPFIEAMQVDKEKQQRNKIIAYMGTGTVSGKKLLKIMKQAFYKTQYEVYVVGKGLEEKVDQNIHTAERFNFNKLLPTAAVMIHHGGQNSVMDALRYGVPQLIYPGKMFERKYNAQSVIKKGAGILLGDREFTSRHIKEQVNRLTSDLNYTKQSEILWMEIAKLGGVNQVIQLIKDINQEKGSLK